jgi:hypothetical protein
MRTSVWAPGYERLSTRVDAPDAGTTDRAAAAEFFKALLDAVTAAHLLHCSRSRSRSIRPWGTSTASWRTWPMA